MAWDPNEFSCAMSFHLHVFTSLYTSWTYSFTSLLTLLALLALLYLLYLLYLQYSLH